MELVLDDRARRLLNRSHSGKGVLITIVGNYGLPGELLFADWCRAEYAKSDPDLVRLGDQQGVPIYAHRRVAAYGQWHVLVLTARLWWPSFAIVHASEVWHDLVRWENTHPGLCPGYSHLPAA